MARIRSIKPTFFTSEDVASLTIPARLLFVGLWTEADREGRLEYRPRQLKGRLFPFDDIQVEPLMNELEAAGMVQIYNDDAGWYASIPTWHKHQRVHPKESPSTIPAPPPWKKTASREKPGCIPSSPGGREGKGREGDLGREGSGEQTRALAPVIDMPPQQPRYMRPGGKHGDCLTGCATGMCLHEQQAMELAARLPGGFSEEGLEQLVTWATGVVEDHKLRGVGMRDKHEYDFWKHRWVEQFGGSAPSFAQLREQRAAAAFDEAFNG